MKNISFDNPYLLLIAIPLILVILVPYFIIGNKDNRSVTWKISIALHIVIIALVSLAAAGLKSTSILTQTTVYVVADVSYSSQRNLDEIDGYIQEIQENLPVNSKMGVVCFGKNQIQLTPAGNSLQSVTKAMGRVDDSATDIAKALNYTETLFKDDSLKRIVLITDGNDTINGSVGSIASAVSRLTENGIKIDAIFLNNNLKEGEIEVQISDVEFAASTYLGHKNEVKVLLQASDETNVMLELYQRPQAQEGEEAAEFEKIDYTVLETEAGLIPVTMNLPSNLSGTFEFMVKSVADDDISTYNNERTFTQEIVGKTKIMLVTGNAEDESVVEVMYGAHADIDSYVVRGSGSRVPFTLEELVEYDEIVVSNVDIRDIRNVNAFVDSLDMAISQYGKSLITFGDLRLQTDAKDDIFNKFKELLPVNYGNSSREGRMYTIVLDVSHSMFMASKFTTAKQAAIKLLSILGDDDYVCLVTFSGEIKVETPKKAAACRQELIEYIDGLTTEHGTDIGLGLEEALKTIQALKLDENQVMLISDGFSFDSTVDAVDVAGKLHAEGATVSVINTFIPAEGTNGRVTLRNVVNAGGNGKYYEIQRPEDVEGVVFGSVADDIGDVIIEKDVKVNIVKYNDGIVSGFESVPTVSGYIISMEKYDATVPLTVSHVKESGYTESMPLYAYRSHGNGKVSSFTSNLSGEWTRYWTAADKERFINNLFLTNTPKTRMEEPYTVSIQRAEQQTYIEIVPSVLNPEAKTTLKISKPDGKAARTYELAFDSQKYFYVLDSDLVGTYNIQITYSYDDKQFVSYESFTIPYFAEYNAFTPCDTSNIYDFMRGRGSITEGEIPSLENDKSEISTYQVSFRIPLLIAGVAIFLVDILVRKLIYDKKKKPQEQKKDKGGAA